MFPALTAHAQPAILRIWQEAHSSELPIFFSVASSALRQSYRIINNAAVTMK